MRYERRKELLALLAIVSVAATLTATVFVESIWQKDSIFSFDNITIVATILAGVVSFLSLYLKRVLDSKHSQKRVFIIYAKEDQAKAVELAAHLKRKGLNPWIDVEDLQPGQKWQTTIIKSIEESAATVVLISEHLKKDGFVLKEITIALETSQQSDPFTGTLFPVILDGEYIPPKLSDIQWVKWNDQGLDRLVEGINRSFQNI
jgi:TIR domain